MVLDGMGWNWLRILCGPDLVTLECMPSGFCMSFRSFGLGGHIILLVLEAVWEACSSNVILIQAFSIHLILYMQITFGWHLGFSCWNILVDNYITCLGYVFKMTKIICQTVWQSLKLPWIKIHPKLYYIVDIMTWPRLGTCLHR